jgi:hypothetical protein
MAAALRSTLASAALALLIPLSLAACGGAATPQAASAASASPSAASGAATGEASEARAAGQGSAPQSNVAIVPGKRKLKVAGAGADEAAAPQVFMARFGRMQTVEQGEAAPEGFRIADLPVSKVPEPLSATSAPSETPPGDEAPDIFVDWQSAVSRMAVVPRAESYVSVRVSLRGHKLARLRIGGSEGTVTNGAGGGVYVVCRVPEEAPRRFVSARWESLSASPSAGAKPGAGAGPVTLTVTDAWFDMRECKATVVKRTAVELKPLSGGILYGYREACQKCAPGAPTELVTLLGPMPQTINASGVGGDAATVLGALTRVTLPIRKGGGGSLVARYGSGIVRDWLASLSRPGNPDRDVVVGVDVTQGVSDEEPVALAYMSLVKAPGTPHAIDLGSVDGIFGLPTRPHEMPPIKRPTIKVPARSELVDPFASRRKAPEAPRMPATSISTAPNTLEGRLILRAD